MWVKKRSYSWLLLSRARFCQSWFWLLLRRTNEGNTPGFRSSSRAMGKKLTKTSKLRTPRDLSTFPSYQCKSVLRFFFFSRTGFENQSEVSFSVNCLLVPTPPLFKEREVLLRYGGDKRISTIQKHRRARSS